VSDSTRFSPAVNGGGGGGGAFGTRDGSGGGAGTVKKDTKESGKMGNEERLAAALVRI